MRVLLINGSPHKEGCTYTALKEVADTLNANNIETKIIWLGVNPIQGCIACNHCIKTNNRCFVDDKVNEFLDEAENADGFIFGTPVHFAGGSGALTSFLDRSFYGRGKLFSGKACATVVSCRRGGATAAFDQINKYALMSNMYLVGSSYWNQIHGTNAEEAKQDLEGLQTMRNLGENMAYLLKCLKNGEKQNLSKPQLENKYKTNFIR